MLTVDYEFYTNTFHGRLGRADFERLGVYASAYLDELTMGRASGELPGPVMEKVKLAYCSVVDTYHLNENGGGIASESNDGITVNYVAGVSNSNSDGKRLYTAAAPFLGPTGLMYRGVG